MQRCVKKRLPLSSHLIQTILSYFVSVQLNYTFMCPSSYYCIFSHFSSSFLFIFTDVEGCEHGWRKFHGHCYRYFTRRHTWEDAEKDCREHSGHLASIHSLAEQNFIRGGWADLAQAVEPL